MSCAAATVGTPASIVLQVRAITSLLADVAGPEVASEIPAALVRFMVLKLPVQPVIVQPKIFFDLFFKDTRLAKPTT